MDEDALREQIEQLQARVGELETQQQQPEGWLSRREAIASVVGTLGLGALTGQVAASDTDPGTYDCSFDGTEFDVGGNLWNVDGLDATQLLSALDVAGHDLTDSGTKVYDASSDTVGDGATSANHQSVSTDEAAIGPYTSEVAGFAGADQIAAIGDSNGEVQYFDATGDFGQAINDAWAAAGAGLILLPPGHYSGSTDIVPQANSTTILGAGRSATVYDYTGSGKAFDGSAISQDISGLTVEKWKITDDGGAGIIGCELANASYTIQEAVFRDFHIQGFDDAWRLDNSFFNSELDNVFGSNSRGKGLRASSSVSSVDITGDFSANAEQGLYLAGGSGWDIVARVDANNVGAFLGTTDGDFHILAENNITFGLDLGNNFSGFVNYDGSTNQQGDNSGADIAIGNVDGAYLMGQMTLNTTRRTINLGGTDAKITFGPFKFSGSASNFDHRRLQGPGHDVSWVTRPYANPNDHFFSVIFNETRGATCDSSGQITLSLDATYERNPEVNVQVTSVANVPSGASLAEPRYTFNTNADGDINEVVVQFEWTDGTTPASGDVTADVMCDLR